MKKGITISQVRSTLYQAAKILGDINAVKRGTVDQRVSNRVVGRLSSRLSGKLSRAILKVFR